MCQVTHTALFISKEAPQVTRVTDTHSYHYILYDSKYRSESPVCQSTLNGRQEPVHSQLTALTPTEGELCPL